MDPQLRADIQSALGSIGTTAPALMNQGTTPKLYEIYVLTLLVRALDTIGAQLQARDSHGNPTNDLRFRLGPGRIYNPTTTPGFIHVRYNGNEYEIQNGVQVTGRSGVLHELDISLIDHALTTKCRQTHRDPSSKDVHCLIECKFYGADLKLHLGREFVGLTKEFSVKVRTMASNLAHHGIRTLILKHGGKEKFDLSPLNPSYVARYVPWLAEELAHIL